jgi:hypothetical protein
MDIMDLSLLTVDVDRPGYGWRYRMLPVDAISRSELLIDCAGGTLRPEQIDLRAGDAVRWIDAGKRIQARVAEVRREGAQLRAALEDAQLLPPDLFLP